MNKTWLVAGLAVMFCQGSHVSAGDLKASDISGRIKELRERLSQFQSRDEEKLSGTKSSGSKEQNPEQLTEKLEQRHDAKMLVLFHDQGGIREEARKESAHDAENGEEEPEPKVEMSLAEQALKKLCESRKARQTHLAKAVLGKFAEKK